MKRGRFVTLEGIEGSGKSTQARLLCERLRERGLAVESLREPGSTEIGNRIREILLSTQHAAMIAETEALLYAAARAQMVSEAVEPALAAGRTVVCDRYVDSSIAYQCFGRGLPVGLVYDINNWAVGGVRPDITILLDLQVREGLARATRVGCDRIEAESAEFHERVRRGYLELARKNRDRIVVVDAAGSVELVAEKVQGAVVARYNGNQ